jgi:Tfp pilus assembly protein PilF
MMNVRRKTRTRFAGWQMAVMALLVISLASCYSGKKKQTKERNASVAGSRYQLGWRYFQDGEVRRSLNEFLESVRLQPHNEHYQTSLGQAYLFLKEYALAEEHLRKAIKINPAFTEAHANLALVFSELGDYAEAEKSYIAALQDPAYLYPEKVYLNWGKTLIHKGDFDGAEVKFRMAVELNPRYVRGYQELGRLLEVKGEDDAALDAYLKAYAGFSEAAELNLKIGELYLRQGRAEQARRFLQKVIDTAPPESSEALRARAFLEDLASG